VIGLSFVLLGNLVVLAKPATLKRWFTPKLQPEKV